MIRVLAVTALAFALWAVPAGAHYKSVGKECKSISFAPQTDSGASAIHAKGVKCRAARRMVRAYHDGDTSPRDFSCRNRHHDDGGLSHLDVVCKRGAKRVSWAAT